MRVNDPQLTAAARLDKAKQPARIRVGTSGWSYVGWRGRFYPKGLSPTEELSYASREFSSLEINRSFYSLLTPKICRSWYEQTPEGFVFALKGSRFITHNKKLLDAHTALSNFFASGVLALADKLGPIVWQLPRTMAYDQARIEAFLGLLPKTSVEAARLARGHDERIRHGAFTEAHKNFPLRHVIEPRHESFSTASFVRAARRFNTAIAVSDSPDWPRIEEVTADFVYLRLHGSQRTYASAYSDAELGQWARRIRAWRSGEQPEDVPRVSGAGRVRKRQRDVYVYFDNDAQAHATHDARRLAQLLGGMGVT